MASGQPGLELGWALELGDDADRFTVKAYGVAFMKLGEGIGQWMLA